MAESLASPVAAVILAAGKGTRMKSETHKVLHPIGGRPMLMHLMSSLGELLPQRTLVVVGDRAEQLQAALTGTGAELVVQQPQLGTGHAVLQAVDAMPDFAGTTLILFGDVPLLTPATMKRLLEAVDRPGGPDIAVLAFRTDTPGAYGRVIADADGTMHRIVEAKDASAEELQVRLCNSGLMAVRSEHLGGWLRALRNDNAAGEYYLTDLIALARESGRRAVVLEGSPEEVIGVNSRNELAVAEGLFQARYRQNLMALGVTLVAPESVFFSHDTEIGADTLVEPHVVFGPGVRIAAGATIRAFSHLEGAEVASGCEVGPYARLRPGTVLHQGAKVGNFVETKKAVLGAGAKANHLSYLGDAEIGAKANIGAGTITCNYDGFLKYRTVIGEGAFIGSNSSLVAPVNIGAGAIVGAGSAVTKDVETDSLTLVRAPQESKPGWAARFRAQMQARKDKR
ncbi:bifunctional UDP-N-acetylglucosamine diphosphorylase/glucosamine-1-phosphate N-acetyltransferase GlmU [Sandaracinobacter sp. RS1-74]|uniref:bifunctional UDP-N-acetylglucosamine diphosphorylase/glucosamine-1-phosphate N-acetyltransferase GlmU n=1 Tax=Sandaracinobacteroides sayramensis TaxID=2913411 RepID=UPI001EDA1FCF|nr:bifunctional UDP-N-acetylglucosamine diphosphorylase/glucosamine-1-phosphate N-acetyltransferase GlmU [Sandaracinobacteroides sayramensis]MCG2841493.1 bifunctional UDP-N-acetylglucosamine diphosphorylase/glucosamine-1-phosphate N-acetyltransferase GlmU [Sandaracinobacteroides sayramensis]